MIANDAKNSANRRQPRPTSSSMSCRAMRSRSSVYSTATSSSRVRSRPSMASASFASAPRSVSPRSWVPSAMAVSPAGLPWLAAIHEQADREADAGRDADGLPGMVVHVVVRVARCGLGAVHRLALELLQLELGGEQPRLDLRTQVARLVTGFLAGLVEQGFGFGEDGREFIDELVACGIGTHDGSLESVSQADGHYSHRAGSGALPRTRRTASRRAGPPLVQCVLTGGTGGPLFAATGA